VVSEGRLVVRERERGGAARSASDGELIRQAGLGDRAALEHLYDRYARTVFGLALRRLGDRGRAEDAVQETFVSIWRAAKTYDPERGPGAPWLFAVARNAIADRSRARTEPPVESTEEVSLEAGPADRAEQAWTQWRVHRALEELPEPEREVIALARLARYSVDEIANLLDIAPAEARARMTRGLRSLS